MSYTCGFRPEELEDFDEFTLTPQQMAIRESIMIARAKQIDTKIQEEQARRKTKQREEKGKKK